ncbi:MAG: ATP-binding cassette domain-containing protein [Acidimicrobiales bacterium]
MTVRSVGSALRATGLHKSFGNNFVLDGIDLDISEGRVFSLLGPNGAGKTTAVRISDHPAASWPTSASPGNDRATLRGSACAASGEAFDDCVQRSARRPCPRNPGDLGGDAPKGPKGPREPAVQR